MIEWLNLHKKSLMKYILWLVIPSFVLLYGYGQCAAPVIIEWVVKVNGEEINALQLQNMENNMRNNFRQSNPDAELDMDRIRQQAMQQSIITRLMQQTAEELGLSATNQEVRQAIQSYQGFLDPTTGQFDYNRYVTVLQMNNLTPEEFETEQRQALITSKIQSAIEGAAVRATSETERREERSRQQMEIEMLAFEPSRFTDRVEIDEAGLTAFFEENIEDYRVPEKRRIAAAEFRPSDFTEDVTIIDSRVESFFNQNIASYATPEQATIQYLTYSAAAFADQINPSTGEIAARYAVNPEKYQTTEQAFVRYAPIELASVAAVQNVTDEAIEAFYSDNIAMYTHEDQAKASHILLRVTDSTNEAEVEAARTRILEIKEEIESGSITFAEAAIAYSEDPSAAQNDGSLGYFNKGAMVPEFEEAAFNSPLGEITDPVQTQFGIHILLVEDRREAGTEPLEDVREDIREQMAKRVALDSLRDLAAGLDSLDEVADQYPSMELGWIERGEDLTARLPGTDNLERMFLASTAFRSFPEQSVRLSGNERNETVYLVQVTERMEPQTKTLAEATEDIIQEVRDEQGELLAQQAAEADYQLIESASQTLTDLASLRGLTVNTSPPFARDAQFVPGFGSRPTSILANAFSLEPGQITGPLQTSTGTHIIQLVGIEESRLPELEEVRPRVETDYRQQEAERLARRAAITFDMYLFQEKENRQLSLTEAAEEQELEAITTDFFAEGESIPLLGMRPAVNTQAFSMENVGELNETPIEARSQSRSAQQQGSVEAYYIIELLEIQETYLPTLDEVREDVEADYKLKEAEAIVLQEAQETQAMIQAMVSNAEPVSVTRTIDLEALANEGKDDAPDEGGLYRGPLSITGTGQVPGLGSAYAIVKTAMALDKSSISQPIPQYRFEPDEDGQIVASELQGVYIIQVLDKQIQEEEETGFAAQIERFLEQQQRQMTASAWLEEASAAASIEYNVEYLYPEEFEDTEEIAAG